MTSILNNRYRLIKPLGEGGFGNTFLAEDTHMPSGRRCVIKQLKAVTDDPQYYQLVKDRFQREAATLEKLGQGHKQIPDLYAYFAEADQFYLVQEWIEGETLTKLLANGKSPQVKELLVSLLPVLAYIHSNRIVHRDIKPDNIIIRSGDNQPVLIDFGAVKEAMGTVVNSQGNATNSIVIGTPGFMPSEQAAGRPVYSSDLYSLGLVGVYCLTGKMPQELSNDPQTDELLWQQHAPQVNPQLATVINKAIMSHPRNRFSSAQEMLTALQSNVNNVNVDNAPTIAVAPGNRNPVSQEEFAPTVAVSAPSSQTVAIPTKKSGLAPSIILGSFIIGSLLGFSLMLGLMLSNTSNQTDQETASSTTESSQSDSSEQNSSTTQSSQPNSSGQSSSTTKSPESNSSGQTSSAIESSQPNSSKQASSQTQPTETENNSSTQEKSKDQSKEPSQPTENNQSPEPVAEESPSDTQKKSQLSPQETVSTYYQNLNKGNLEAAWEKLPKALQNNPRVHPQGYISYAKWFNQVDSIDVQTIEVREEKEDSAKVDVRFKYNMKSGQVSNHYLRYNLIWDEETKSWQFWQITNK